MATISVANRRAPTLARVLISRPNARGASTFVPTQSRVRNTLLAAILAASAGVFAVYYFDARSALHRYVLTPLIRHAVDPETGHRLAVKVLASGVAPRDPLVDDEKLKVQVWDRELANPVGLAAGFDKDGEAIEGLFNLGFSWVEIGSVTPKPQTGNPKPRVFHLAQDSALINRYGFPSRGHPYVLARLRERCLDKTESGSLLAVNLGKNKESPVDSIDDFVAGVKAFGTYADVLVVNVSSPNTPGLRGLQNKKVLDELLAGVIEARDKLASSTTQKPKLVLKIAPDLDESQLVDIADVCRKSALDGVIVSNTTTARPANLSDANKAESGGLSGAPLKQYSLATLRTLRRLLPESIPLIGCGGISTGADALEYAKAGASFVQVYTGFGYDGVGFCRRIKDELVQELDKEGTTWRDVVHKAVKELSLRVEPAPAKKESSSKSYIGLLIKEAEDLKKLLDQLGERIEKDGFDESVVAAPPLAL